VIERHPRTIMGNEFGTLRIHLQNSPSSQFQNTPFCPISASSSNREPARRVGNPSEARTSLNPRNTQCIPVVNPAMAGSPSPAQSPESSTWSWTNWNVLKPPSY